MTEPTSKETTGRERSRSFAFNGAFIAIESINIKTFEGGDGQ